MESIIDNINKTDALSILNGLAKITNNIDEDSKKLENALSAKSKGKDYNESRSKIVSKYNEAKKDKEDIENAQVRIDGRISNYKSIRDNWSSIAEDVCKKAAILDLIVTYSAAGIKVDKCIHPGSSVPAGIYSNFSYNTVQRPEFIGSYNLKGDIGKDFKTRLEKVYPVWLEMAKAFWNIWKEADEIFTPNYDSTFKDLKRGIDKLVKEQSEDYDKLKSKLQKDYSSFKDIGKIDADINELKKNIANDRTDFDKLVEYYKAVFENDPILGVLQPYNDSYGDTWLNHVKRLATERKELPYLRMQGTFDMINLREKKNIYISALKSDEKGRYFKALLATYMFAFPESSINIDIIEKDPSPQIIGNLDKSICHITNYNDFQNTSELTNRLKQLYKNQENKTDKGVPVQLTVFYGYDDRSFDRIVNELGDVITNGPGRGLYFILVAGEGFDISRSSIAEKFNPKAFKTDVDLQGIKVNTVVKVNGKDEPQKITLEEWLYNHLSKYEKNVTNKICPQIYGTNGEDGVFYEQKNRITEIIPPDDGKKAKMVVPFGETYNGKQLELVLSSDIASCAFVVGQTGSGKSFLLHSILTNLMLKYDTTAVKLILMDFKTAGVEFEYYKGVPHVSHLLVNGNDKQIVQEILRSLNDEMDRRGNDIKSLGCQDVAKYNEKAKSIGKKTYPYIVMAVDECSGLFDSDEGVGMRADEIKKIITKIAKEGRSQGIFMILATQTYHGSGIPHDVIKQFNTFLLQKCSSDDVTDCDINDNDLKARVPYLQQGQVIMYRREPKTKEEGLVYDYAGVKLPAKEKYKNKTQEYLRNTGNFNRIEEKQFYFSSTECVYFENEELKAIDSCVDNGKICLIPGKRIATDRKPVVCELKQASGNNVLIVGTNNERQAERVLWSSVVSLWKTAMQYDRNSEFYIFDNTPDGKSLTAVSPGNKISELDSITFLNDYLKSRGIDSVFSTVFLRKVEQEEDNAKFEAESQNLDLSTLAKRYNSYGTNVHKRYTPVFLILPNHDLFVAQLAKEFNIPKNISDYKARHSVPETDVTTQPSLNKNTGDKQLKWNISSIHRGNSVSPTVNMSSSNPTWDTLSSIKSYVDAFKYILNNGPEVGVYTVIQTSNSNKIIPGEKIYGEKLLQLFSEIIMLKMPQINAEAMSLGYHRLVANLSAEIDRLRGLIYSPNASTDNLNNFIPFDFPKNGRYI